MRILVSAAALLIAAPVLAATPGSWTALDGAARKACERDIARLSSQAKVSGVSGRISGIGAVKDADRYYALVLDGKAAGFRSEWLCLYDKRDKTAVAREIERR